MTFLTAGAIVSFAAFIAATIYFSGAFGSFADGSKHGRPDTPLEFFHSTDTSLNTINLFVATVTVSSGIGFLLAGGQINGLLMLLVPVAMLLGYQLFAAFFSKIVSPDLAQHSSFWAGSQAMVSGAIGKPSILRYVLVGPLALIFLLFCAFELLVASQIIEAIMLGTGAPLVQLGIAAAMFSSTLALSWRGGVQSVFRADRIQFVGILVFAAVFMVGGWLASSAPVATPTTPLQWLKIDARTLTTILLACLGSVSTQFYSTINHHIASNSAAKPAVLRIVMRRASLMMAVFFSLMILIGLFSGIDWAKGLPGGVKILIEQLPLGTAVNALVLAMVVVGLACVTMSTLDSLMVAVTMQIFDGILGQNSRSDDSGTETMVRIRRLMLFAFGGVIAISALAFFTKPSIFFTLLAIASGAESLAPLILLIGFLSRTPRHLAVLSNGRLSAYLVIFFCAVASNLTLSVLMPTWVPYVSLSFLLASVSYSFILWTVSTEQSHETP